MKAISTASGSVRIGHQGGAEMQEKPDDQHADDDQFLDEVLVGGGDGFADQVAPVIGASRP